MAKHYSQLSPEGQITIPSEIRKELGMEPGEQVTIAVKDGKIVVESQLAIVRRLAGSLREYAIYPPPTAEELRELAEEAWAEDALGGSGR